MYSDCLPKLLQLSIRYWDRSQEVDPLHHLIAGWGCQRSFIVRVVRHVGRVNNICDQFINPEATVFKGHLCIRVNHVLQSISERGEVGVVLVVDLEEEAGDSESLCSVERICFTILGVDNMKLQRIFLTIDSVF